MLLRRVYGVTPKEALDEWTYWQFKLYTRADVLCPPERDMPSDDKLKDMGFEVRG